MQNLEQKKLLDELKNYERKMTRSDEEQYKMFVKRQKDDEDFDSISFQKLKELHKKYVVRKSKEEIEKMFSDLKKKL